MSYRVVHCGTGNVGSAALRAILDHPDLELVGHYVHTPAKVGRDSGELVGAPPACPAADRSPSSSTWTAWPEGSKGPAGGLNSDSQDRT